MLTTNFLNSPSQSLGNLTFREAFALSLDKKKLIHAFQECGVIYERMNCTKCEVSMRLGDYPNLDGSVWRCGQCKSRTSIRKDSYFKKHKLEIGKIFMFLYCYLKYDKMQSNYISEFTEISENSLVDWGCYVRKTISNYFLVHPYKLGAHHPVQIDESLFGGRMKYHVGDHAIHQKAWVFGMVKESTKLCVFWMVNDRTRTTLFKPI